MLGECERALRGPERGSFMILIFVVVTLLTGGCSAKRAVTIPSEWRTTPPQASSPSGPGRAIPLPGDPSQPIMRPTPDIQERNLTAVPERSPGSRAIPEGAIPDERPRPEGVGTPETPQYLASMHLVNSAKTALRQGHTEQAIAQLEQAIQVDAYNAEAFQVLAQAWLAKGDTKRALEFARKAEILYQDEPEALRRVYLLEADLLQRSGQASEAEIYRQKAARLEQ
jgi:hypothetical protein